MFLRDGQTCVHCVQYVYLHLNAFIYLHVFCSFFLVVVAAVVVVTIQSRTWTRILEVLKVAQSILALFSFFFLYFYPAIFIDTIMILLLLYNK